MSSLHVITSFDTALFHWCQRCLRMHAAVGLISRYISRIGDGSIYLSIAVWLVCFDKRGGVDFLCSCLFAFVIVLPLYLLLKNTIRRDRPCDRLSLHAAIRPADVFSFPSGHTAFAFTFATVLSETYPAVALLAYAIATLIGLSRVLLSVHYPADVFAGAALGLACADLSVRLLGA